MRHFLLLVTLVTGLEGTTVYQLVDKQTSVEIESRYERRCDVRMLSNDETRIGCKRRNGFHVPNGEMCSLIPKTLDRTFWARCEFGNWISIEARGNHQLAGRVKRAIVESLVAAGVGAVIGMSIMCAFFCKGPEVEVKYVVKKPPTYSKEVCPPRDVLAEYFADKGTRYTRISWTVPVPTDSDGSIRSNTLKSTPGRGETFKGSVHGQKYTVMYQAIDSDGLSGYCFFDLTVNVRACKPPSRLVNGYFDCDEGNIYGSTCTFYCDKGYERTGSATATCKKDGKWTSSASCIKKRCDEPKELANGTVKCLDDYVYQSTCSYECNTGFRLKGSVLIQCQANQEWKVTEQPRCVDAEPPRIDCWSPQILYADRGVLTSSFSTWEEPKATDSVDPSPQVNQIDGPKLGDTLNQGSTSVTYNAIDESGNKSPNCTIELRVQAITCGHPADFIKDNKLRFNCSDSLYYYGVSCQLSCDYHLPLEGVDLVTCETLDDSSGIWDWGSGDEPYCREVECPPLDAPINGGFVRETVNLRPVMILMCNKEYDINYVNGFDGKFYCYDSGKWGPLNETIDCIRPRRPGRMNLPSELYYYSGECSDEATLEEIKKTFLVILENEVSPVFNRICPGLECTIDAVTVTCGPLSDRRKRSYIKHHVQKRSAYVTIFSFDITTEWNPEGMTVDEAFDYTDELQSKLKEGFASLVNGGKLDLPDMTLRNNSFKTAAYGSLACEPGTKLDGGSCKPCPRGMYLDEITDECKDCPLGQYMDTDGTTSCKMCPVGKTTERKGSKSLANCTDICRAGSFSKKGLAPCSLCPVATYQESDGMTECTPCPPRQTTASLGSTSQDMCQPFDVRLRDTIPTVTLGSMNTVNSLTIMTWAKLFSGDSPTFTSIQLMDGQECIIAISLSPAITVEVGGNLLDAGVMNEESKWYHIAVVWDRDVSLVQINVNGQLKGENSLAADLFTSGEVLINSFGSEGIYLSGLQVVEYKLNALDIQPLLTSCTEMLEQPVITMGAFLNSSNSGINIITPTICDAVDECDSSPCGEHLCENEIDDFRCVCSKGMTGRLCDVPKDHCIAHECKHGATCKSHDVDYSCICAVGYSGHLCEIPPVDGGWSQYNEWSGCTVTCGFGTRSRTRTCDNPPPGPGGMNCTGSSMETEDCDEGACRECDEFRREFGIKPNCTTNTESKLKQCKPYCREGTVMPTGIKQFDTYICGPETDYEWTPFNRFPNCTVPGRPNRYVLESEAELSTAIPSSSESDVQSKIRQKLSTTDCVNKGLCAASVSLASTSSRRKRNTGSTLSVLFEVELNSDGELELEEYVTTGNVSSSLQEILDSIVSLELTAADLQANASLYFNVDSGGVTYSITESTLTLNGIIDCPQGSVSDDGVCVKCPVGTNAVSNACIYCDVGTYQDETGQISCKPCPSSYSTTLIGSTTESDCTVLVTQSPTSVSTSSTTTTNKHDRHDSKDRTELTAGVIAGIAIGSFAAVLAIIAIILVFYKKHARKSFKENNRTGSLASLSMIRPISGQRAPVAACPGLKQSDPRPALPIGKLAPVQPTKAGLEALGAFSTGTNADENQPDERYVQIPPNSTCASPPPPYTERP